MAAPKAPLFDSAGKKAKDLTLEETVFGAQLKPHVVHETVRAEMNADRRGTRAAKSRGLVSGGRSKPWRQKGTGRARAGTTRAPQWTGGGVAFPPTPRDFDVKVNRKTRRSALRGVLSQHAADGTLGVLDGSTFTEPSTRAAVALLATWGKELPAVVVTTPGRLEVTALVWARSVLLTQDALELVEAKAANDSKAKAESS